MATKRTISTFDSTKSIAPAPATPKVNYLNNRDILKEIHSSKNTYCYYKNPETDSQYDIILPSLDKINQRTIAEARRNRADRLKRLGTIVDPVKIPSTWCSALAVGIISPWQRKKFQNQHKRRNRNWKIYLNLLKKIRQMIH